MPVPLAVVPPAIALLRELIKCISQLQESSKKNRVLISELKRRLEKSEAALLSESKDRRERDQWIERRMTRAGIALAAIALSSWVYIGFHLSGLVR